ncbi:hypothetical protein DFH11DRAFT_1606687 [Phellopilus nigrolimitatus]|nr:hypothetical protein DFH11DRAFT_1606687 [Phellopilus nigrolimitatus]
MPVAAAVNAEGVGSPNTGRKRSPLQESDSGEDDEENKVQISASVAEQRLAALHKGKRPAQPSQLSQQHPAPQPQRQNSLPPVPPAQGSRYGLPSVGPSQLSRVATAPLGYPYNLPPPMPPSTPRTTRRNMLTHELSESLRRNLLWERQVSKQRPMGLGRRALTGNAPPNPPSNPPPSNGVGGANDAQTSENVDPRRQKALARNRSWADNYHAAGW